MYIYYTDRFHKWFELETTILKLLYRLNTFKFTNLVDELALHTQLSLALLFYFIA